LDGTLQNVCFYLDMKLKMITNNTFVVVVWMRKSKLAYYIV